MLWQSWGHWYAGWSHSTALCCHFVAVCMSLSFSSFSSRSRSHTAMGRVLTYSEIVDRAQHHCFKKSTGDMISLLADYWKARVMLLLQQRSQFQGKLDGYLAVLLYVMYTEKPSKHDVTMEKYMRKRKPKKKTATSAPFPPPIVFFSI